MTSYAIGYLHKVEMGADIIAYLEAIDATLAPFDGKFVIHGGQKHELEGIFPGDLIVIAFPSMAEAHAWYASPAYQNILPLRSRTAEGSVFLIEGVDAEHKATDILSS